MWRIKSYNPFEELNTLQEEMNRLFNNYGVRYSKFPAVNIYSTNDEVVITAEIPGLNKEDLNISVHDNNITIEGERKELEEKEGTTLHRKERGLGKFTRSFRLPYEVDSKKTAAKYHDGILTVTLPRLEATKPRKIAVVTE